MYATSEFVVPRSMPTMRSLLIRYSLFAIRQPNCPNHINVSLMSVNINVPTDYCQLTTDYRLSSTS